MRTNIPFKALWCFDFDGVVCHSAKELCITAWSAAKALWPEQTSTWPDRWVNDADIYHQINGRWRERRRGRIYGAFMCCIIILLLSSSSSTSSFVCPSRPGKDALESFYKVRPVVETGWEAMVINRALQQGTHDADTILRDYTVSYIPVVVVVTVTWADVLLNTLSTHIYKASLRDQLLKDYGISQDDYMNIFRDTRAAWLARDEAGWIAENGFYPGAVDSKSHIDGCM